MLKKAICCLMVGLALNVCLGCGQDKQAAPTKQGSNYLELKDSVGRLVVLPKQPQRVVALSPSHLEIIDAIGGTVVGRPTTKVSKVPVSMEKAAEIGFTYNVNMEAVFGLKPDLVIATTNQHAKFIPMLESNKIPTLQYGVKSLKDLKDVVRSLGKVYNTSAKAEAVCKRIDQDIDNVKKKLPSDRSKLRVAIMFATATGVTVAGPTSIAGGISDILGFENVAAKAIKNTSEKTPYSMESLVEQNPEIIFITTMGKPKDIEKRLQQDFKSNPAWGSLTAVKNNKIYVLPENMFLVNPGIHYPTAVEYMAKNVYPQSFK